MRFIAILIFFKQKSVLDEHKIVFIISSMSLILFLINQLAMHMHVCNGFDLAGCKKY